MPKKIYKATIERGCETYVKHYESQTMNEAFYAIKETLADNEKLIDIQPAEPLTYQERMVKEARELADKIHKLEDFMRTDKFYNLIRSKKDLMYEQLQAMLTYIHVLGKRLELEGIDLIECKFFE